MVFLKQVFAPKSRIPNVEVTVVQKMHIAASDKRGVIVCRGPFLVTFLGKQKSDTKTCFSAMSPDGLCAQGREVAYYEAIVSHQRNVLASHRASAKRRC